MNIPTSCAAARATAHAGADANEMRAPAPTSESRGVRALAASLGDFVRAGLRPKTPLQRGIVTVLAIKLLVIIALRVFVFTDGDRVTPTDQAVARLIGVDRP